MKNKDCTLEKYGVVLGVVNSGNPGCDSEVLNNNDRRAPCGIIPLFNPTYYL